jgi:hypothetical protein
MSEQQSRAAYQGDATPRAGRAVADEDVREEEVDAVTLIVEGWDLSDPAVNARRLSQMPNTRKRVRRALERFLASRAAQATPAEGADEQEPGECADCGTLLVQSEDAFCEDCEGMRRAACRRQPAGAADRTRGAGEDTLDEQWLKSIEARMSGDPAAVTALLGEIRGYLRAASHAIRDRDTRIDALEQECATLLDDAARLDWLESSAGWAWFDYKASDCDASAHDMWPDNDNWRGMIDAARAGRPAGEGDHA